MSFEIKMPIDISCEELLNDNCTYCGWLRKKPKIKLLSWQRTYCVLNDRCFYYFKNENSKSPTGKFPLYGYNRVKRNLSETVKWGFILEHVQSNQPSYKFAASSQQEMVEWMKYFKEEMLRANNQGQRTAADGSDGNGASYIPDCIERIEEVIYNHSEYYKPVVYQNEDCHDSDLDVDPENENQSRLAGISQQNIEKMSKLQITVRDPSKLKSSQRSLDGNESLQPMFPRRARAEGLSNPRRFSYEKVDVIQGPQASWSTFPKKTPEDEYWNSIYFYGDKDDATRKIEEIAKDGVYLVRDSDDVDAPKVLVTYSKSEGRAKKFKIFMTNVDSKCMYYMKKELMFESVEEVIYYHYHHGISSNPDFKITEPYLRCNP